MIDRSLISCEEFKRLNQPVDSYITSTRGERLSSIIHMFFCHSCEQWMGDYRALQLEELDLSPTEAIARDDLIQQIRKRDFKDKEFRKVVDQLHEQCGGSGGVVVLDLS